MNSVDRFFEACQVADAEEIHFKKPDRISGNVRIKRVHIVLSDDLAALRIVLERSVVIKRFRRDDYAGGVDRDVPRRAFQFFGQINDSFRIGFFFINFFEFRNKLHGVINGHWKSLRARGDHF